VIDIRGQQQVQHAQEVQPRLDRERDLARIALCGRRRRAHALALDHDLQRQGVRVVPCGGDSRVRRQLAEVAARQQRGLGAHARRHR
jgi:hypothetical protein